MKIASACSSGVLSSTVAPSTVRVGQPLVYTSTCTPGTPERDFCRSIELARNSWNPAAWLARPAINAMRLGPVCAGSDDTAAPRTRVAATAETTSLAYFMPPYYAFSDGRLTRFEM